jgi:hypothetical protein
MVVDGGKGGGGKEHISVETFENLVIFFIYFYQYILQSFWRKKLRPSFRPQDSFIYQLEEVLLS